MTGRIEDKKARPLNEEDLAVIREEESALDRAQALLRRAELSTRRANPSRYYGALAELRDEAAVASESDLPALFEAMHTNRALAERPGETQRPDLRSPYFAHMRLREDGRVRDVFLGHGSFIHARESVAIIDWRNAPISRIFYNYREGDEYSEEMPGHVVRGVLEARRVLTVQDGRLLQITTPDRAYSLEKDGWAVSEVMAAPRFGGGEGSATRGATLGTGQTGRPMPEVSALLDAEQFALLQTDDRTPLLILGGAGCGKTTVALHRLAALAYRDPVCYAQSRIMVVVPERGLTRLSRKLLDALGMTEVRVTTFDDWIRTQARMILRGLPDRVCDATPPRVSRFKRHPAMLAALPPYLANLEEDYAERIRKFFDGDLEAPAAFRQQSGRNLMERLSAAEKFALARAEKDVDRPEYGKWIREIREFFSQEKTRVQDVSLDRLEIFGDRKLLEIALANSKDELTPGMADDVIAHSRAQFAETSEERWADVDKGRRSAIDGRSLDAGTPESAAGTIDVEDYAVLFELLRLKAGRAQTRHGRLHAYAHMVIDEAQDLAPAELRVLGQALRPSSAVTIAGDAAQQIDPDASFSDWEQVLDLLRVPHATTARLKTSYRSAKTIAEFAHALLGPLAPPEMPRTLRDGAPVGRSVFPSEGHSSVFLSEVLFDLSTREPMASVAVICRSMRTALRLGRSLRHIPRLRVVMDGEFDFKPGTDVTDVAQVKGLEFDYVIVPDADANNYPDTPESRRALHVASTRAIHQLWVISLGKASPILPEE